MRQSPSSGSTSGRNACDSKRDQLLRLIEARSDIDGRFTDIRRLGPSGGHGAFSLLFTALDSVRQERVAIKVFHPDVRDAYRQACFEREEAILHQLAGEPDIITWVAPRSQFVEVLTAQNGRPFDLPFDYFGLELASSDVESAIYDHSLSPSQLLLAFHQMCRGVQRLHAANIAHRDIKPSNFLLMGDGSVRLSDLGTARQFQDRDDSAAATYWGPPGDRTYCAPEMLACIHDVGPELAREIAMLADVYSLGASLFEMFTGAVLNVQIMDAAFFQGLALVGQVGRTDRVRIYHELLPQISGREFPNVLDYGWTTAPSIAGHVNALCGSLADLDYRSRLTDFNSIFRRIQICRIILHNEEASTARRRFRERIREARQRRRMRDRR